MCWFLVPLRWALIACLGSISSAATQPASGPVSSSQPAVDAILDGLERRGQSIDDLSATLTWQLYDEVVEEAQTRHGQILYRREEPNSRFLIRFDDLVIDQRVRPNREWHVFDGHWYIEKREVTKSVIKREYVRPGETVDLFRLGKGPFPLPFGQKKADILEHFQVERLPPAPGEPPDADHLLLVPRPGTEMADKYRMLDFYIDRKLDLPRRVRLVQKDDKILTVDFSDVVTNAGLAASRFEVSIPKDWELTIEHLPPAPAQPPPPS